MFIHLMVREASIIQVYRQMVWYTGRRSQWVSSIFSVVQEEMPSVENGVERYCGGLRCVREV